MSEGLPLREEVPVRETWDLKDLFTSDQAFYQTLEQVVQMSLDFNHTYYQKLNNIETIEKALDEYERILIEIDRLYNYPELRLSVDTANEEAQKLTQNLIRLLENLLVYYLLLIPRFWSYPMIK